MRQLWRYRQLLYFLSLRDIKVRYKQTIIGIVWALIKPLITMIVFSFLFGTLTQGSVEDIPYPIFIFFGLLLWNIFYQSVIACSESIVANNNLINKVYFPRIILPLSAMVVVLVDFLIASIAFILLLLLFHFTPSVWGMILIPIGVFGMAMLGLGVGMIMATLNVRYRDIRVLLPFVLQLLLFVTPVIYPVRFVSESLKVFILFNPLALILNTIRDVSLQKQQFDSTLFVTGMVLSLIIFAIGIKVFQDKESEFADLL